MKPVLILLAFLSALCLAKPGNLLFDPRETLIFCCENEDKPIANRRISDQKCMEYNANCTLQSVQKRSINDDNNNNNDDDGGDEGDPTTTTPQAPIYGVVGGIFVYREDHPHMAAIGWIDATDPSKIQWNCGGSLISENFVLTAGHCTTSSRDTTVSEFPTKVRLGEIDLSVEGDEHVQIIDIAQIIKHPEYNPPRKYHDLALLKLARNAILSDYVRPICLWQSPEIPIDSALKVTGWGRVGYLEERSNVLLEATLSVFNHSFCNSRYPPTRQLGAGITTDIVCAGSENGDKDTCQGDSGGPLIINHGEKCKARLVGVTSFGKSCGTTTPGAYMRISSYIDWIEANVWLK